MKATSTIEKQNEHELDRKERARAARRRYAERNKEKIAERGRKYKEAHREEIREKQRIYDKKRAGTPARIEARRRDYAKNGEKRRAAKRAEYAADPEKIKARNNLYYARTKHTRADAYRESNRKSYAKRSRQVCAHQKAVREKRRSEFIEQIFALLAARSVAPGTKPVGVIYKIENVVTRRVYIGQTTVSLEQRYRTPFYLQEEKKKNERVAEDLRLYGKESFSKPCAIYACYSEQELDYAETYFIDKFNSVETGYNIIHGIMPKSDFRILPELILKNEGAK